MGWVGNTYAATHTRDPNKIPHLFFVITSGEAEDDTLVLLNMSSLKDGCDETCVLRPDDPDCECIRRFLKWPSCIMYGKALKATVDDLCRAIDRGKFIPGPKADHALIHRIQDGALESPNMIDTQALSLITAEIDFRAT